MSGTLYGVGLGPGASDLVSVRAARIVAEADVIAFHSARHGRSIARATAAPYLRGGQVEEALVYPVTTEGTEHPGGYVGAMDAFYAEVAERLAAHLEAGRSVAVLCEGDPSFYGSYQHLHTRLAGRFPAVVVPGIPSISAAAAATGLPLVQHEQVLTVLPGTLPPAELVARLAGTDAAAVLKLGRTFPAVRAALDGAGLLERAWYVERAGTDSERVLPLADVAPAEVPYMSIAIVPGKPATRTVDVPPAVAGTGSVVVVGLGPGDPRWLTPQARDALAQATDLVGYVTYVNRVPDRPGLVRHLSDNKVEAERAAFALDLALRGHRVAVVSSGDPGVFAMASAVLEVQASDDRWTAVDVTVVPGLTAAQAVASRVGAPLGHDFCVISLSDRLKPWDVVERRLDAVGAADLVLAVYNPASRERTWQVEAMVNVLSKHRHEDTVVVVARDVGGPTEAISVVTLGTLDPAVVDMRTLLLVGSSTTRVTATGVVFTPRTYPQT